MDRGKDNSNSALVYFAHGWFYMLDMYTNHTSKNRTAGGLTNETSRSNRNYISFTRNRHRSPILSLLLFVRSFFL